MCCVANPIRHKHGNHHRHHHRHHQEDHNHHLHHQEQHPETPEEVTDMSRLDEIIRHRLNSEELRRLERRVNNTIDDIYSEFVSRCRHLSIIPYLDCLVQAKERSVRQTRVRLCSETMETYISCVLDRHSLHRELRAIVLQAQINFICPSPIEMKHPMLNQWTTKWDGRRYHSKGRNVTKLPYNLKIAADCLGVSATLNQHHLTLNCSSNEQIAVDYIQYGFKQNTSTQCYGDLESKGFGECCSTNSTDCFVFKNDIAGHCTGQENCVIRTKQLESTSYPHCDSHLNVSSSIKLAYYCVFSASDSISNVTATCGSDAQYNATSTCPNTTSQESSTASTGSSTSTIESSPSTPESSQQLTDSSSSTTESSPFPQESPLTSTGSSTNEPISSTHYTQEVMCDQGMDSNCTTMISTNSTQNYITENIPSSNSVDTSMIIGVVSGAIILTSVIVVVAIVLKKKGKQKVSEKQSQENTKIRAWV
ncbi:hypothetical protein LOTGIDRAFT_172799 [Lottia gigantea]|uniref:SUEL-type lectin domain-containing protein n=1 Tax=Lottia gigantea TaxID=225164 RepID=V4B183_LOTGI|nr:hypothetical protein LOTGIDRAFT_172799 [Lottia gigantea]ESP01066.1 hypothetical protein LOTGIDRAFT_172799 [Lottia gigantea]